MPEIIKLFVVRQVLTEDSYTINIQFRAWFCITDASPLSFTVLHNNLSSWLAAHKKHEKALYINISFYLVVHS